MWLRGLELSSFRNYAGQAVAFGDGVNVVYGLNGQGKTNLLEGAYYCSTCKSHRTSRDADLIMGGGESFSLRAATESRFGGKSVGIRYDKGSARQVTVNGNKVAKASQVMGSVCSVLFSPEDTQMLRQGPSARRRFLDVTLCQVRPAYLSGLQAYGRALRQKNAYLSGGMGDRGVI
ncbi:MAG: AAA family ATPase, partial [Oscillospiraceae bacterium]|nr:AAA family ATPase [Oscillospiraceae bacterium]